MDQRVAMFLLPLLAVFAGHLGAGVLVRFVPVDLAPAAGLPAYYLTIAASVLWVRKAVPGAHRAPSFYLRRPAAWRVVVAGVLPALPLAVFFLLNLGPLAPAVAAGVLLFSAFNATCEETFWRGLMVHLSGPDWVRILYPAAVFSFMHWFNVAPTMQLTPGSALTMIVATFALAVVWMWFYLREQSLIFPIASHFAIDGFALLAVVMTHHPRAA